MNAYLKIPSEIDESKYMDYVEEFIKYSNNKSVFCIPAQKNYKRWLKNVNSLKNGKYRGMEPATLYFFMDDEQLIGHVIIKHKLNFSKKDLLTGNIDGSIRPTMRNKGYGKQMLSLALKKCSDIDLNEITVVNCEENNILSSKNIVDNGGVLDKIIYDSVSNIKYKQYKIKVKK